MDGQRIKAWAATANTSVSGRKPNVVGPLVPGKMSGAAPVLNFPVFLATKNKTKSGDGDKIKHHAKYHTLRHSLTWKRA